MIFVRQKFDTDPVVPFPPVVEPDLPGAFITKHPRETIGKDTRAIPLVIGINFDEGLLKSARETNINKKKHLINGTELRINFTFLLIALMNISGLFDEFANNINDVLPIMLYYDHHNASTQQLITQKVKQFYFDDDVRREKELNITNVSVDF